MSYDDYSFYGRDWAYELNAQDEDWDAYELERFLELYQKVDEGDEEDEPGTSDL